MPMSDCTIQIPGMRPRPLTELVAGLPGATVAGDPDTRVHAVAYDSREITPHALFVAIQGGYADGHAFLDAARVRGATSALVDWETPAERLVGYRSVVRAHGTRAVLAHVAARFFDNPSASMRVVGVTGTDGKTTTSHMIEAICRASGRRTGLIGTVAVRVGACEDLHESRQTTPESLQVQGYLAAMRADAVEIAVLEATSHGLAMHRLDGCAFDVGVVTNITHEHLDFHGSIAAYRRAKAGLLERVSQAKEHGKLGAVVLNVDDEGARSVMEFARGCEISTFSARADRGADLYPREIDAYNGGARFTLVTPLGEARVNVPMPGSYNVANALAATGACIALGLSLEHIVAGLSALPRVPGRMEVVDAGQEFVVVVDYAHTPEALAALLREMRSTTTGRLLVLFGSAGERDVAKRPAQGRIGVECADFAVFTSEDPRFEDPDAIIEQIAMGAVEAGRKRGVHFDCIEDRAVAIRSIFERARAGDVVVLAGKGHEHSMIYGAERRPWDEAEQARSTLRAMGYAGSARNAHPEDDLR